MSTFDSNCAARVRSWWGSFGRGWARKSWRGFYQSRPPTAADSALITAFLKDRDCTTSPYALPRQAQHQSLKLLGIQFQLATLSNAWPVEFSLVQPPCRQPNTNPVMNQHFHAIGPAIGKQISAVRLRRTEHRNHPGQCGLGTRSLPDSRAFDAPPPKKTLYVSSFGVDVYSGFQQKIPNFVDLRAGLQRPIHSYWQSAGPADIFINQGVSNEVQLLQRRPDRYFSDQE